MRRDRMPSFLLGIVIHDDLLSLCCGGFRPASHNSFMDAYFSGQNDIDSVVALSSVSVIENTNGFIGGACDDCEISTAKLAEVQALSQYLLNVNVSGRLMHAH